MSTERGNLVRRAPGEAPPGDAMGEEPTPAMVSIPAGELERLRQSDEILRRLDDTLPQGAIFRLVISPDGRLRFTSMSRAIERIIGVPVDEVLRDSGALYALVHADDLQPVLEATERSLRELTPFEMVFRQRHRRTGAWRWTLARSHPHREPDGSTAWDGVTFDVTELVETREALDRATRREAELLGDLALTFEHAPLGVAEVSLDGRFLRANRALCALLGYAAEELLARTLREVTHPDDLAAEAVTREALLQGAPPAGGIGWRCLRKDGAVVEAIVHLALLRDAAGAPLRGVLHVQDVTEQRRLQAQLLMQDRLATLGTLAAGAAHEINNPLASIMANLEYVQGAVAGDLSATARAEVASAADEALLAAARVRDVVAKLRSFGRLDALAARPADVHRALAEALEIAAPSIRRRARLVRDFAELPPVAVDEGRLAQAFLAVLANAAQALPQDEPERHEVRVCARTDAAGSAVVEVHDTGRGFEPGALARAFEPFFTTRAVGEGAGLGLALAHGVITGAGGGIAIENRPEGGATVRIALPPAGDPRAGGSAG